MTYWDGRYLASGIVIIEVGAVVVQGAIREIRFLVGTANASSVLQIPGGGRVVYASVQIADIYTAGAEILLGHAGDTSLLMVAGDNKPQKLGTYIADHDALFPGVATSVLATVNGAPIAGSAIIVVRHTQPEA